MIILSHSMLFTQNNVRDSYRQLSPYPDELAYSYPEIQCLTAYVPLNPSKPVDIIFHHAEFAIDHSCGAIYRHTYMLEEKMNSN